MCCPKEKPLSAGSVSVHFQACSRSAHDGPGGLYDRVHYTENSEIRFSIGSHLEFVSGTRKCHRTGGRKSAMWRQMIELRALVGVFRLLQQFQALRLRSGCPRCWALATPACLGPGSALARGCIAMGVLQRRRSGRSAEKLAVWEVQ